MPKYYIETISFAAPFFSDEGFAYIEAETPEAAVEATAHIYEHPAGLYAAVAYSSADAKNQGERPLATWLCNYEIEKRRLTEDLDGYTYEGIGSGMFKLNDELHVVANPHDGRVVPAAHKET